MDNTASKQKVIYPVVGHHHGDYSAESHAELNGDHRLVGLHDQELPYTVTDSQTEMLPYSSLAPCYGYPQSHYVPCAVVGTGGQLIGAPQFFTSIPYEQLVYSPAYIPATVLPSPSRVINAPPVSCVVNNGMSAAGCRTGSVGTHYTPLPVYADAFVTSQRVSVGNPTLEASDSSPHLIQTTARVPDGSQVHVAESKQYQIHEPMIAASLPHASRSQGTYNISSGAISSIHVPLGITMPANSAFTNSGSIASGVNTVDMYKPRVQFNGALTNGKRSPNILGDQIRGRRNIGSKHDVTSATVQASATQSSNSNMLGNRTIYAKQYNRDDFVVDYPVAKFFVIKSYTADDVHKSIKFNVWSSTSYGNKKLDSAYEDAQRMSKGRLINCPVFLFFSVNTSRKFCGVAEMIGRVGFRRNMDFWQQHNWGGSFPVRWHIIKDVPNFSLRHILLENNEYAPVTNSRDTQEITYVPGMGMLRLFKHHPLVTSLLSDFMCYDVRERIMREQRFRFLARDHTAPLYSPVYFPSNGLSGTVAQPTEAYEKQPNSMAEDPPKEDEQQSGFSFDQSLKLDEKESSGEVREPPKDRKKDDVAERHPKAGSELLNNTIKQPLEAKENLLHVDVEQRVRSDAIQQIVKLHDISEVNGMKASGTAAFHQPSEMNRNQSNRTVNFSPVEDGNQPEHATEQQQNDLVCQTSKAKQGNGQVGDSSKPDQNPTSSHTPNISCKAGSSDRQGDPMIIANNPSDARGDAEPRPVNTNGLDCVQEFDSLSSESGAGEAICSPTFTAVIIGTILIRIYSESESVSIF